MTMASNSRNMKRSLPMIELGPSAKSRKPEPPTYTMRDPPDTGQLQQVEPPHLPTNQTTIDYFVTEHVHCQPDQKNHSQ